MACSPGLYDSALASTVCQACTPGLYASAAALTACVACNPGNYQTVSAASACLACSLGLYSSATASTACQACSPGLYASAAALTACVACNPGNFQNVSVASTCLACDQGAFQSASASTACAVCGAGTFTSAQASTVCESCLLYSTFNTAPGASACQDCTLCDAGAEWFSATCGPTSDSSCGPCGVCPVGDFLDGDCNLGSTAQIGQPVQCQACPLCPVGKFLSAGCADNAPPVCSNCTVCASELLVACAPLSDTVCSEVVDCRRNASYAVYPWLTSAYYCDPGQYLTGIDAQSGAPTCATCPWASGLYGPNGLWCDYCPGYRIPYYGGAGCVCSPDTEQDFHGDCVCGPGNEFLDDGCASCGPNTYSNETLVLTDAWYTQAKACVPCPAGFNATRGAAACAPCPNGTYREDGMDACEVCPLKGYYAADATNASSCAPCNATCAAGYAKTPCPVYPDMFLCVDCAPLPPNATRHWTSCGYICDAGFYSVNGTCAECASGPCPPGYNRSACSDWADTNCDAPCEDPRKPTDNSEWTSGCEWACAPGYSLLTVNYVWWTQTSCVPTGAQWLGARRLLGWGGGGGGRY